MCLPVMADGFLLRQVLLALALDLEEKLCHHVLTYKQVASNRTTVNRVLWKGSMAANGVW